MQIFMKSYLQGGEKTGLDVDNVPRPITIVYRRNGSITECKSMEQSEKTLWGREKSV